MEVGSKRHHRFMTLDEFMKLVEEDSEREKA